MRRRIFLIALICMVCTSCAQNEIGKSGFTFFRSYVNTYADAPMEVFQGGDGVEVTGLFVTLRTSPEIGESYSSPEWNSHQSKVAIEHFWEIAERNGDCSYNRDAVYEFFGRAACTDNFREIRVVCLNLAWDAMHPAGSLLNDLLEISFLSYAEYIHNGYKGEEPEGCRKPMAELSGIDLAMLSTSFYLYFDKLPVAGSYEIKVTMITTENIEKVATCTFVVE